MRKTYESPQMDVICLKTQALLADSYKEYIKQENAESEAM